MLNDFDVYIYPFFIEGYTQSDIVNKLYNKWYSSSNPLNVKKRVINNLKSRVSSSAKKLDQEGYIKAVFKNAKPKIYRKTSLLPEPILLNLSALHKKNL